MIAILRTCPPHALTRQRGSAITPRWETEGLPKDGPCMRRGIVMSSTELLATISMPFDETAGVLTPSVGPSAPAWTSPSVLAWCDDEEDDY